MSNQLGKGLKKERAFIPLNEILEGKHPKYQTYKLKVRLIQAEIFKDECSRCGWKEKWMVQNLLHVN